MTYTRWTGAMLCAAALSACAPTGVVDRDHAGEGAAPAVQATEAAQPERTLGPKPDRNTFFMQRGLLDDPTALATTSLVRESRLTATAQCVGTGSVHLTELRAGTVVWDRLVSCAAGAPGVWDLGVQPGGVSIQFRAQPSGQGQYYVRVQQAATTRS